MPQKLREELSAYQAQFLDLERDLIGLKESLVGREELEAAQSELAAAREENARLGGQLAERETAAASALAAASAAQQALQQSSMMAGGAQNGFTDSWASMHAPSEKQNQHAEHNFDAISESGRTEASSAVKASRSRMARAPSSTISLPKTVEKDDSGWWS